MSQDNISIRLKVFMDSQGLTNSQFADTCGIPRPSLSQLLSGRNKKISDVLVGQIHAAYPDLSILWLMFGEGDMLVSPSTVTPSDNIDSTDGNIVPVFGGSLFDEDVKLSTGPAETVAKAKENGLETVKNTYQQVVNKNIETDKEIRRLQLEIEKLKNNPRKVSQITIYYDDSTFETFYPRK